jgi:hypothetical protein
VVERVTIDEVYIVDGDPADIQQQAVVNVWVHGFFLLVGGLVGAAFPYSSSAVVTASNREIPCFPGAVECTAPEKCDELVFWGPGVTSDAGVIGLVRMIRDSWNKMK